MSNKYTKELKPKNEQLTDDKMREYYDDTYRKMADEAYRKKVDDAHRERLAAKLEERSEELLNSSGLRREEDISFDRGSDGERGSGLQKLGSSEVIRPSGEKPSVYQKAWDRAAFIDSLEDDYDDSFEDGEEFGE